MSRPHNQTQIHGGETRRSRIARAEALSDAGKSRKQIAEIMGCHQSTIDRYLGCHEQGPGHWKGYRGPCSVCGAAVKCERWKGKPICPECLNPDGERPKLEHYLRRYSPIEMMRSF